MMIDWVSAVIESPKAAEHGWHLFDTGEYLLRERQGEIRRVGTGREEYEGSYSNKVSLKSALGYDLFFSGNPVKYFQGHNLFGSDDPLGLLLDCGWDLRGRPGGQFPSPLTYTVNEFTPPRFTRLDLTRSYRFDSNEDARSWIRDTAAHARSRHGAAVMRDSTAYFGNNSEYWTFKVYNKRDEINSRRKGHSLPTLLLPHVAKKLLEWSEGVIRFELTLKSKELARCGEIVPGATLPLWQKYYDAVTWNRNAEMIELTQAEKLLPLSVQRALLAWRHGEDLRPVYSSSQFYAIRRKVLDTLGVDIAQPPVRPESSAGVVTLKESGWDPEPLTEYLHTPSDELKKKYGLMSA
jgi:II/X family phage/plasmid replication protein